MYADTYTTPQTATYPEKWKETTRVLEIIDYDSQIAVSEELCEPPTDRRRPHDPNKPAESEPYVIRFEKRALGALMEMGALAQMMNLDDLARLLEDVTLAVLLEIGDIGIDSNLPEKASRKARAAKAFLVGASKPPPTCRDAT